MKPNANTLKGLLLLSFMALLFSCKKETDQNKDQISHGKETYYWYQDKKIPLFYDNTTWVIKTVENATLTKTDFPGLENKVKNISAIGNDYFSVIFIEPVEIKQKSNSIKLTISGLVGVKNDTHLLPTGEITVSLKENANLDALLAKYQLKVVSSNANSKVLLGNDPTKAIETANLLFENEKESVLYAEPNFWSNYTIGAN